MWVPPNRTRFRPVTALFLVLILASFFPFLSLGNGMQISDNIPTRDEEGPIVNRSVVEITLHEGYGQLESSYLNATGFGAEDIFYDPNYEWKEGDDIPYPLKAFEARYPSGFNSDNTPIEISIVTYYLDTNFGMVTITENREDWNTRLYSGDWFEITLIGRNRTGESEATLKIRVLNVNDRPTRISDKDYFSIKMPEDGSYIGINKDHDMINEIFGDNKDPFDTLTYTYEIVNDLAENITVELTPNGSFVKFIPEENWSCPYLPNNQRLKGRNIGGYMQKFAVFRFNCSDQDGKYVRDELYVYVEPINDVPEMEPTGEVNALEDELVSIQLEGTDIDIDQTLVYGTNLTTSIYEETQEQIEFQEEYFWDSQTGLMEFMTNNDLVGSYRVMAYVQDKSTEPGRPDYPPTPYRIYQNFTLNVINVNDDPLARLDQPISTFVYNTSSVIEFNASRSSDIDLVHGDELNYTWTKDGEVLGYGKLIYRTISEVGEYNITVNVTDKEGAYSVAWVNIEVEKARVPGEIFQGKDMERTHTDNNTAIVISRKAQGDREVTLFEGGPYALDVSSVRGTKNGAIYKVRVMFGEELDFLFTEEITQEPKLELYFLTPDFNETRVELNPQKALDYEFPVPFSNVRYTRLEFDLKGPSATYPPSIVPLDTIRMLDDGMGVEITLTVVEMDDLGIKPDFDLYAVAQMKTTIKDVNGVTLEVLNSWDSTGLNTEEPVITDATEVDDNGGDGSDFPIGVVIIIVLMLIVVAAIIAVLVFLMKGKKEGEEEPAAPAQPQQSVEDEIFGGPVDSYRQYPDAQQMYGQTTGQQQQGLPQPEQAGQQQQGLPPAQSPVENQPQAAPAPDQQAPPQAQPADAQQTGQNPQSDQQQAQYMPPQNQ